MQATRPLVSKEMNAAGVRNLRKETVRMPAGRGDFHAVCKIDIVSCVKWVK